MKTTMFKQMQRAAAIAAFSAVAAMTPALHAQEKVGSIHGKVTLAVGIPASGGQMGLTTNPTPEDKGRKYEYTFPVGTDGSFKADNIKATTYVLFYLTDGKTVDYIKDVKIQQNQDLEQNDDMTRPEFINALTADQRKAIDKAKHDLASTVAANSQIKNVNGILLKARDEIKAGNFDAAATDMTQATQAKPDEPLLWNELGNAQLGGKKYDDAIVSYQKAVDLSTSKPNPAVAGNAYSSMAAAYIAAGKPDQAMPAFDKAAAAMPAQAGLYYTNAAVLFYKKNDNDQAAAAADKAIAADPTGHPDAYYLKAQALVGKSTVDPKSQKIVPPPGCYEAYMRYLEVAPNGPHAEEVKQITAAFDDKVVSSYKAGGGKRK